MPSVGQTVAVRGRVSPAGTRRKVTVQVAGDQIHTWTDKSGTFVAKWKPRTAGTSKVRVRAAGNLIAGGSKAKAGKVSIFRPAEASYYGPGLYGNGVACGGTLSHVDDRRRPQDAAMRHEADHPLPRP